MKAIAQALINFNHCGKLYITYIQDHVCFVIWSEMHSDSPIGTHTVMREPDDTWPS